MRTQNNRWFADYLPRIGNGPEKTNEGGNICLPEVICMTSTCDVDGIKKLIDHMLSALEHNMNNLDYITSRAMLFTKNMRMIAHF